MVQRYIKGQLIVLLTLGTFGFSSRPAFAQMWLVPPIVSSFHYDNLLEPVGKGAPINAHTTCAAHQGMQVDEVVDASGNGLYKKSKCNGTAVGQMLADVHLVNWKVEGAFLLESGPNAVVRGQFTGGVRPANGFIPVPMGVGARALWRSTSQPTVPAHGLCRRSSHSAGPEDNF